MKKANITRHLMLIVLTFSSLITQASYAELSVIVNEKNKNAWTEERIRNAYVGRLKSNTEVIEQGEGQAARAEFREKFLGKTENQIKRQWSISIFSGGRAPTSKAGDREVLDYMKTREDAIGYVSSEFFQKEILGRKEGFVEVLKIK